MLSNKLNKLNESLIAELQLQFPGLVEADVDLSKTSRWRIGGIAKAVIRPCTIEQLCRLRRWIKSHSLASVVIGETSNLLFSDEGLEVVCIQLGKGFSEIHIDADHGVISVGASAWVPLVARKAMQYGIAGLEHICGIPGTMGGLVCMNGGSMRHGISEAILEVSSVTDDGLLITRSALGCNFSYRQSIFQSLDEIIVSVKLHSSITAAPASIRRNILNILKSRRTKFPRKLPNCGSVFVSDPAMYERFGAPGKIIENLGYKGFRDGGAMISTDHANFIVNISDASSRDVLNIVNHISKVVLNQTGFRMVAEVRYVNRFGEVSLIES